MGGADAGEDVGDAGTLHLLRADELPRYGGALARLRPRHHVPAWLRHHGLTRAQADAIPAGAGGSRRVTSAGAAYCFGACRRGGTIYDLAAPLYGYTVRGEDFLSCVLSCDDSSGPRQRHERGRQPV